MADRSGTPAAQMVRRLASKKRQGLPWPIAWADAWEWLQTSHLESVEAEAWRTALLATEDAWRAAYEDRGDPTAYTRLAWLLDAADALVHEHQERPDHTLVA